MEKEKKRAHFGSLGDINVSPILQRMLRGDSIEWDTGVGRILRWPPRLPASGVHKHLLTVIQSNTNLGAVMKQFI